jgi:type I restriction enzyme M protein
VLFRDEEREMRARLVDLDHIECVIGLGPNLFYNSPMEACVVVCRTLKPPERWGKILFINAVNAVTRQRAQSYLEEDHIEKIVLAYREFKDVLDFARVVGLNEIRGNGSNLSIAQYVRPANGSSQNEAADGQALAEAIHDWQASSQALRQSMDQLFAALKANELLDEGRE